MSDREFNCMFLPPFPNQPCARSTLTCLALKLTTTCRFPRVRRKWFLFHFLGYFEVVPSTRFLWRTLWYLASRHQSTSASRLASAPLIWNDNSDGPEDHYWDLASLFRPDLLQRCARLAHGMLRRIHHPDILRSQWHQRKRSQENNRMRTCWESATGSWVWGLHSRCPCCRGRTQRTIKGMSVRSCWFISSYTNLFDFTSPERRNRARWSRVDSRKKSFCDSNRSCSGLRRRSTMRRTRTIVPKRTLELMLVIEENCGRFYFCVYGRGGTGVNIFSYSLFRSWTGNLMVLVFQCIMNSEYFVQSVVAM